MKTIKILISLLFIAPLMFGQSANGEKEKRVKGQPFSKNSIYVGIMGPSVPASLNYERIWTKKGGFNISTKLGGFYSEFPNVSDLTLANGSFEVNFLFGRTKNMFEMDFGWSGYYGSFYSEKSAKMRYYGIPLSTFGMYYRFQKPSRGFFLKTGFSASTVLAFITNDLTELAVGNALIYGVKKLTDAEPAFSLMSFGLGYSF